MSVVEVESGGTGSAVEIINTTDFDITPGQVAAAVSQYSPVIAAMTQWTRQVQTHRTRHGNLIDRDQYVTPSAHFDQIRLAREALDDDVVGNVAETTESLVFKRVSFGADDADEEDVWNQWAADVELDARLREMWQALFTDSQFVMACWWGTKDYTVRGETDLGNKRRKTFAGLQVPTAMTLIDSLKVYPVGNLMFNQEQLAYIASPAEAEVFEEDLAERTFTRVVQPVMSPVDDNGFVNYTGQAADEIVRRLIIGRYEPSMAEMREMVRDGVESTQYLYLLNPKFVFRHTSTRAQYRRFPRLRMKRVFPILDMKEQLRHFDRTYLLAGTQFIILIRQGTEKEPALPEEIAHLRANVRTIASVPLIVSDHRLQVDIVTPDLTSLLKEDSYDTLDKRLRATLLGMLGHEASKGTDMEALIRVVGGNLMSVRHMLLRTIERNIMGPIFASNDQLTTRAKMYFHPSRIALEFDKAFASFLLDLRELREISRDTILSQFELDQGHEARMLEREAAEFDAIFHTLPPPGSPGIPEIPTVPVGGKPGAPAAPAAPAAPVAPGSNRRAGRRLGGTRNGGGAAPGSGQGEEPRRARKRSDGGRRAAAAAAEDRPRTRAELLEEARELQIRGRHRMTADELEDAIAEAILAESGEDDQ